MGTAAAHYERSDLGRRILEGLRAAGVDPEAPTPDDLAPVDHFHTRARAASRDLRRAAVCGRGRLRGHRARPHRGLRRGRARPHPTCRARRPGRVRPRQRPGGILAIHEVTAGPGGPIHLPVPWAREPAESHLWAAEEVREMIASLGFREVAWDDQSVVSLEFNRARVTAAAESGLPPLGLHLLLGDDYPAMIANQVRNLDEERIRIVMGVWRAT